MNFDLLDALAVAIEGTGPEAPGPDTVPITDVLPAAEPAREVASEVLAPVALTRRESLNAKALEAAHLVLDTITRAFRHEGADLDDAVKCAPHLLRVMEHAEKLELAKQAAAPPQKLPTFRIVLDRNVKQVPPEQQEGYAAARGERLTDHVTHPSQP